MKMYPVPPSVREQLLRLGAGAAAAVVLTGASFAAVHLVVGGAGSAPLGTLVGMLAAGVVVLSAVTLLAVLVSYIAVKLGAGRHRYAAAAALVERFNAQHAGVEDPPRQP